MTHVHAAVTEWVAAVHQPAVAQCFFGKMGGADPLWLATHTTAE